MTLIRHCTIKQAPLDYAAAPFRTKCKAELRTGRIAESRTLAVLPEGTPVVPIDSPPRRAEWRHVETPAGTGWIRGETIARTTSQ